MKSNNKIYKMKKLIDKNYNDKYITNPGKNSQNDELVDGLLEALLDEDDELSDLDIRQEELNFKKEEFNALVLGEKIKKNKSYEAEAMQKLIENNFEQKMQEVEYELNLPSTISSMEQANSPAPASLDNSAIVKEVVNKISLPIQNSQDASQKSTAAFSAINDLINSVILKFLNSLKLTKPAQSEQFKLIMKQNQEAVTPSATKFNSIVTQLTPYMSQYWESFPASKAQQTQFTRFLLSVANSTSFEAQVLAKNLAENFFDKSVSQNAGILVDIETQYKYDIDYPKLVGDIFKINSNLSAEQFKQIVNHFSPTASFFEKFSQMDLAVEHKNELGRILIQTQEIGDEEKLPLLKKIYKETRVDCAVVMDYLILKLSEDYKNSSDNKDNEQLSVRPNLTQLIDKHYNIKIDEQRWLVQPHTLTDQNLNQWARWYANFVWLAKSSFDMDYENVLKSTGLFSSTIKQLEATTKEKKFYFELTKNILATLKEHNLAISSSRLANIFKIHVSCTKNQDKKEDLQYGFWQMLFAVGVNSILLDEAKSDKNSPYTNPLLTAIINSLEDKNSAHIANLAALALIHAFLEGSPTPMSQMHELAKGVLYSKISHAQFKSSIEQINSLCLNNDVFWTGADKDTLIEKVAILASSEIVESSSFVNQVVNSTMPWWWGADEDEKYKLMQATQLQTLISIAKLAQKNSSFEYRVENNLAKIYLNQLNNEKYKAVEAGHAISKAHSDRVVGFLNIICSTWPQLANTLWKAPITTSKGNVYYCVGDVLEKEWGVKKPNYLNSETIVNNIYEANFGKEEPVAQSGFFNKLFGPKNKKLTIEEKILKIAPFRQYVEYSEINKNGPSTKLNNFQNPQPQDSEKVSAPSAGEIKEIMAFLSDVQFSDKLLNNVSISTKIKTQSLLLEVAELAQLMQGAKMQLDIVDSIQVKQIVGHCRESMQAFANGKESIEALKNLKKSGDAAQQTLDNSISTLEREYGEQISILTSQLEKIQTLIYAKIQGNTLQTSLVQSRFLQNKFNHNAQDIEIVKPASLSPSLSEQNFDCAPSPSPDIKSPTADSENSSAQDPAPVDEALKDKIKSNQSGSHLKINSSRAKFF